jgi:Plasmid pRiA4b ORF-3-like protein
MVSLHATGRLWRIPGFYDLVEALSDPNHERHEQMLDWNAEFDPQAFPVESVNRMLTPLGRRRQTSRG